jgi:hypothetical protein
MDFRPVFNDLRSVSGIFLGHFHIFRLRKSPNLAKWFVCSRLRGLPDGCACTGQVANMNKTKGVGVWLPKFSGRWGDLEDESGSASAASEFGVSCPNCHREVAAESAIWNGVKRWARTCVYCGALLLSTVLPGQLSPPEKTPPLMIYVGAPGIYTNTAAAIAISSFDKKPG